MDYFISKFIFYRPRIIQFFGILGALSGAIMFYLENSFISYPGDPDLTTGRTVAYIVKYDLVRFVTPTEALIGHATHYIGLTSMCLFGLLLVFEMKKRGVWFRSDQ